MEDIQRHWTYTKHTEFTSQNRTWRLHNGFTVQLSLSFTCLYVFIRRVNQEYQELTEIDVYTLSSCLDTLAHASDKLRLVANINSGSFQPYKHEFQF